MGGENIKQAKKFKYTIRICHCIDSACFAPSPPRPPTHTLFHHLSPSWSQWSCLGNPHIMMLCRICNLPYHPHPRWKACKQPKDVPPMPTQDVPPIGVYVSSIYGMCFFIFHFLFYCWGLVSLLILQVFEQSFNVVGKFNCVIVFLTSIVVDLVGAFFETQI